MANRKFTVTIEIDAPLMRDVHAALDAAINYLYTQKGYLIAGKIREKGRK